MTIKQLSVFVENKQGRLSEITGILQDTGVDIRALSLADTTDFGILRLIVDKEEAAEAALEDCRAEDILRLVLTGESEGVDLPALLQTAAPYRWAVTVRDHTRIPQDLWGREAEDSLTGLFLRDMRRCRH